VDDLFKEFEQFFSMGGEQAKQQTRGSAQAEGRAKGKDVNVTLDIDFMEAINGTQKPISYARTNKCSTCNGSKMKPGTAESECQECDGSGF
jgi:molecular chaperone DnaJ